MGTVSIEYVDLRVANATVGTPIGETPVDVNSIDYTDVSFEVLDSTSTTSIDAGTPPDDATHAVVTSLISNHYIRLDVNPTPTTGGKVCIVGSSRLIAVRGGDASSVLKICTTV